MSWKEEIESEIECAVNHWYDDCDPPPDYDGQRYVGYMNNGVFKIYDYDDTEIILKKFRVTVEEIE